LRRTLATARKPATPTRRTGRWAAWTTAGRTRGSREAARARTAVATAGTTTRTRPATGTRATRPTGTTARGRHRSASAGRRWDGLARLAHRGTSRTRRRRDGLARLADGRSCWYRPTGRIARRRTRRGRGRRRCRRGALRCRRDARSGRDGRVGELVALGTRLRLGCARCRGGRRCSSGADQASRRVVLRGRRELRGGRDLRLSGLGHRLRGLRRGLGRLGWLLRLDLATEAVGISLAAHSVGLCVLNRGGVALDADAERDGQIDRLFVRHPQLFGQLVDADLLGQDFLGVSLTPPA